MHAFPYCIRKKRPYVSLALGISVIAAHFSCYFISVMPSVLPDTIIDLTLDLSMCY